MIMLLAFAVLASVLAGPLITPRFRSVRSSEVVFGLVLALVTGGRQAADLQLPSLPFYSAELILLVGFAMAISSRQARLRVPFMIGVVVPLFVLVQLARVLMDIGGDQPWQPLLQRLGLVEYTLFAVVACLLPLPRWPYIAGMTVIAGQITGVLSLVAWLTGEGSLTINGSTRFLSSNQVVVAIAALVALILRAELGLTRRLLLAALPAISVILVYQRSSWLSAFIGCLVAGILTVVLSRATGLRNPLRLAVGLVLSVVVCISPAGRQIIESSMNRVTGVSLSEDRNVAFRLSIQREQLEQWAADPVFGVGYSAAIYRSRGDGITSESNGHNAWLTALWRTGVVGLALISLLYFIAIARGVLSRNALGAYSASVLVAVAVGTSFNVWLDVPYLAPLAWMLVGFAIQRHSGCMESLATNFPRAKSAIAPV
jgi:O-antigen ligase